MDMTDNLLVENSLVVGEGVIFTGTIEAPGLASINGVVKGKIKSSELTIGPKGMVTGEIEAKLIDVRGVLSEKIVCQEHMVIHRTGLVSGHLDYLNIEIERGGQFEGQMVQHPSSVPVVEDEPAHSAQQAPV